MRLARQRDAVKTPPECALSDITTHEKENPALMNKNQNNLLIIVAVVGGIGWLALRDDKGERK